MESKTDMERFIELYESFGVEIKITLGCRCCGVYPDFRKEIVFGGRQPDAVHSEKFNGNDFKNAKDLFTVITFDKDEKFVSQVVW